MTKQALRKKFLHERKSMAGSQQLKWDELLLIQMQQMDISFVSTLFTYFPMSASREPNTIACTSYMRWMLPELTIAYPVCHFKDSRMEAVIINEETNYKAVQYGIMQPEKGEVLDPLAIDLVLVPLIVCDKKGYRVGYGKGFYDRYLSQCRNNVQMWGLSYFEPVENIDDTHQYDIPLTHCITPYNIYEF